MARTKTKAEEDELEARTQDAPATVLASGVLSNGYPKFSLRAAAKHYNISPSHLTARYNHRKTRNESHKAQQKLTPAQENVLKDWIKSMGRRGVPLSLQAIAEYASVITKEDVGVGWARKFRLRHPDLKARWTTGLEKCRAQCLNRPLMTEYFAMLGELIEEHGIPPENIYNMDEKGLQMGLGKRTLVLVDRDQSMVYHVEDGNRELVTIIKAICADGSSLWPSVIYKGATRDLQWGRNNPAKASISFSPKGWTDNELGLKWLEKDFEPQTAACNISGGWRLLIPKVDWEARIKLVHAEASKRFAEIRAAWEAKVKQRLEERKRLEKEALQVAKAAERVEKEAALEIEKARKAAEKAEAKKLADAAKVVEKARKKELADAAKAAEKERKRKLVEEEKARAKAAEAEARSCGELPAPKAPTKKKGGSAKQGQKRAQVDEDVDLSNKENTSVQPAPKRPRPKPRPIGRPPGSSGALAAVQASSSMNAPVDDALAMIDSVLRPGA